MTDNQIISNTKLEIIKASDIIISFIPVSWNSHKTPAKYFEDQGLFKESFDRNYFRI